MTPRSQDMSVHAEAQMSAALQRFDQQAAQLPKPDDRGVGLTFVFTSPRDGEATSWRDVASALIFLAFLLAVFVGSAWGLYTALPSPKAVAEFVHNIGSCTK